MDYQVDSPTLYSVFIIDAIPKVVQRLKITTTDSTILVKLIAQSTGETVGEYTIQADSVSVSGPGVPEGTVVVEMVNGVVQLSNPITESYLSSGLTLTADETTDLGIDTMTIGSTFTVA